ncbi:hypothetical protein L6164_035766 [Bauhinia variegata]|uniref:Uncharacterized protein n=1 Tax=Bauhinia variegata TaxID=167791 RepID=A0ACB9KF49_BAUVA|nr:hypothetical protein L6164_035766 [Bauhinia variegata]
MSCNGCRVLRKGCSDDCMLRHCLRGIDNPQAESHATLFVAKFFGRATLMSFVSAVPTTQRPALFRSLLYEAVGRTINPVNGAVGLLWTGNWHLCQVAVETVLRGGALSPLPQFCGEVGNFQPQDRFQSLLGRPSLPETVLMIGGGRSHQRPKKRRAATPSEESDTTVDCAAQDRGGNERKLLRLFF